jgi:lambda family phage portal protein
MAKPLPVVDVGFTTRGDSPLLMPREYAVSYAGASLTNRDVSAWRTARKSADSDLLPEQGLLVSRSQDMTRNNGVAKGMVQTTVDSVVGTGLRLSARPDYKALGQTKEWADEWSREVEALYHSWWWSTACHAGDTMTGDQLTAQVARTLFTDGEWLVLPLWITDRGDGFMTKLQTVDPARLCNPMGMTDTQFLRGGIEYDQWGAPIAYHVRKSHPGDFTLGAIGYPDWERIARRTPFGRARVLHGFDPQRASQSKGIPELSAVLSNFKQLDRYTNAEIMAAVVNAMIAMTIETPMDQESILELFNGDHKAYLQARADHAVTLEGGAMLPLFPGDQMKSFLPNRPNTGFGSFCENMTRIIGVGADLPYELVMKDFSKTNYSSYRAAMLEAWRAFSRKRDWLGTQFSDPTYALFLEEVVNDGRIDAPDFYKNKLAYLRCKWIGPGKGYVDPTKEVQAAKDRMDANLSTLEDECAEQGKDWREVLEQKAREKEYMDELGLTPAPPKPATLAGGAIGAAPAPAVDEPVPGAAPVSSPQQEGA